MPISGYFDTIFATSGDLSVVPDATQPSGTVSYTQGFPILYSTAVASGGYNVPRASINQLFYDVTAAIQNWQQNTVAPFITTTMNGGTPYTYPKYAMVLYGGVVYQSLVNSNADTPPSSKWGILDVSQLGKIASTQTITGTNHTFAAADTGLMTLRSNSGTVMVDTLPGTGTGVLGAGWQGEMVNNDSTALYQLKVGSGANLNGSSSGNIILGPGQRCIIFSDGTNYWASELPMVIRLGANTTFYVATTGSDSANSGITSSSPFLTIQHAINFVADSIYLNGFTATISVADGTYTGGISVGAPFNGNGLVQITGNTTTPSNCVISTTNAPAVAVTNFGSVSMAGFRLKTTTAGNAIDCGINAQVILNGNMDFNTVATGYNHIAAYSRGVVVLESNYSISGGAPIHFNSNHGGLIYNTNVITVTVTGTPAFATEFAFACNASVIRMYPGSTFSGSATGVRYSSINNAVIDTNAGGASYFPGGSAGSTSTGGIYV